MTGEANDGGRPPAQGWSGWFSRVPIQDPLQRRNAVSLQVFSLVLAAVIVAVEAGRLVNGAMLRTPGPSLFNSLTFTLSLLTVISIRRGRYGRGVFLFVVALSAAFAIRISLGGLEYSRDILKNIAIPLALTALLLGRRALWSSLACFTLVLAIGTARDHYLLGGTGPHPPPNAGVGVAGFSVLIFIILAVVLDRFGLTMQDAFAAAVARQGELEVTTRELRRSNDALAAEMKERDRLQKELRQAQKMEAIGRLAGGVAHDFNNLLTVIGTNVELAKLELRAPHPVRESLDEIAAAARRGAQLTRQLLAFGRRQVIEPRAFDLGAQVESVRSILQRLLGEEVELRFDLAAGMPAVMADPGQVEQILVNLVVNARDALERHGHIEVSTRFEAVSSAASDDEGPAGDYGVLSVKDDGRGMTADVQAHLFEPFFTTKGPGRGTGLGLSTVYGIARQHGGFVRVATELGRGSTFRVYLPVATRPADPVRLAAEQHPAALPRGSGTVLLAEDDDAVRAATAALLERLGYDVLAARDGIEALELCERHPGPIHVLLTDAIMPQMNGRELADRLRARRPGTPVVFFSGYAEDVIASRGVLEKGVLLVRKPYLPTELASALRVATGGAAQG
ncbi:MAG: hypothetical protein NVSMB23_12020 [Myxococcales bacterium]